MNLSITASFWVIAAGVLIWLGAAWLCWANWQRSGKRRATGLLEVLRFVLITMIVATLLRPEFVQQIKRTENPEIAVLMDSSESMTTRDIVSTNRAATRADWLAQKRQAQFWKPLEKSGKVVVEDFSAPTATTNSESADDGTDLNRALEIAAQQQKNLKAVLLLTDGDWNSGKSPLVAATRLREQNVPVFAVTIGRETPIPDLVLENVSAPSYGLFGEQIAIPFKIQSHLPREVRTEISLAEENWDDVKKEIVIPANGEIQEAILWSPHAMGDATLTLKLPIQPDEGINISLWVKKPGFVRQLQSAQMSFTYHQAFMGGVNPDAYERVLVDAIRGDNTLFATSAEVMAAWRIIEPVIQAWSRDGDGLQLYTKGSEGQELTKEIL